ncbi:hypothetical protein [Wandonia haliotis]|uniref:hypothetical protein n=1 Tax=Wandonia haliotis TaxID=574963 RepID=UPI0031E35E78
MESVDLTLQQLVQVHFSGQLDERMIYINLAVQAITVMFIGLFLWRLSVYFQRKKMKQRRRSPMFEPKFGRRN